MVGSALSIAGSALSMAGSALSIGFAALSMRGGMGGRTGSRRRRG
jgi:hypothetical protein